MGLVTGHDFSRAAMAVGKGVGLSPCHGATRQKCVRRKYSQSVTHFFHDDEDEHGPQSSAIGTQCGAAH